MRHAPLTLLIVCAALISAPAASAQSTNAPPGNSGLDQYLETVPDASGVRSSKRSGKGTRSPLSPEQQRRLEQRGAEGRALAQAVAEYTPDQARSALSATGAERSAERSSERADTKGAGNGAGTKGAGKGAGTKGAGTTGPSDPAAPGSTGTGSSGESGTPGPAAVVKSSLAGADSSGGGMGVALPLLLGLGLAGAGLLMLMRHRRTDDAA
jgi:hypothetical protein